MHPTARPSWTHTGQGGLAMVIGALFLLLLSLPLAMLPGPIGLALIVGGLFLGVIGLRRCLANRNAADRASRLAAWMGLSLLLSLAAMAVLLPLALWLTR